MKTLQLEAIGGASGDMLLGALIGLGVDAGRLEAALHTLCDDAFSISVERVTVSGISGLRASVNIPKHGHDHHHDHHHDERHTHGGHGHSHAHHGAHRHLGDIEAMIRASRLPEPVKQRAIDVFGRIADAEGEVHGMPRDHVHFHEVGALDSIVDIVGCCLALHELGVDGVVVGPLPQGRGTIHCAHGVFPNPAPATLLLSRGMRIEQTDEPHELVTPTGAALLAAWKTAETPPAGSRVAAVSHSFGHRALDHRPNLLRATLLVADEASGDECLVIETNIDDATPETIGAASAALMEAGALDVFCTPIQMKKQRPGMLLTVLCAPAQRTAMIDTLFAWTPTFGVREHTARRTMLARRHITVETTYGPVRVKIGSRDGVDTVKSPEYDDCMKAAAKSGVPFRVVYDAAKAAT